MPGPDSTEYNRLIRASYACTICGDVAGTIELEYHVDADKGELRISGLVCHTTTWVSGRYFYGMRYALAQGDESHIVSIDRLWISFYCPECERSYCKRHWQTWMVFDDDFPGWYDCTRGTCPAGHEMMVDD